MTFCNSRTFPGHWYFSNNSKSLGIVGVHLLWMFVGPFALVLLLMSIVETGSGWLTGLDIGLLIVVVLMLCARWIDQRSGQASTVYGEPSTWSGL